MIFTRPTGMQRIILPDSDGRHQQRAEGNTEKCMADLPFQVNMFSLSNFGPSKVKVAALEDVKLIDIDFKIHDPHKIVENHLAQFNMRQYVHENSPYGEIFRGVRSYKDV
jgi:hypothetical protein